MTSELLSLTILALKEEIKRLSDETIETARHAAAHSSSMNEFEDFVRIRNDDIALGDPRTEDDYLAELRVARRYREQLERIATALAADKAALEARQTNPDDPLGAYIKGLNLATMARRAVVQGAQLPVATNSQPKRLASEATIRKVVQIGLMFSVDRGVAALTQEETVKLVRQLFPRTSREAIRKMFKLVARDDLTTGPRGRRNPNRAVELEKFREFLEAAELQN